MGKVQTIPADSAILDLEDAVSPSFKAEARASAVDFLRQQTFQKEVALRINALDTEWGEADVRAVAELGRGELDMVVLPKVEGEHHVHQLERLLDSCGADESLGIACMIETPRGVLRAEEIAGASDRVVCIIAGTSDLTTDLRAMHVPSREPLLTSLSLCVLAARAHDIAVLDGVYLNFRDADGFEEACVQGRQLGFDGKTVIHPSQVQIANSAFSPSETEIANASRIIEAYEEALSKGKGVATLDNTLIENLHVKEARRILQFQSGITL